MKSLGRLVAVGTCIAALGLTQAVTMAAPAGAGDSAEDQGGVPVVDGVEITATYLYEGMPFFQGGYILKGPQLDNFVSIDCGANGVVNPAGGPDGAPECSFHPAVTEATVTITGDVPWFEIASSFEVVPYWSFDDKTYVKGEPITITAPKPGKLTMEQAAQAYLDIGGAVNVQLGLALDKIDAWNETTTGAQAAADVASLDQAFDEAKNDLKTMQKGYPPAKKAIKKQLKAINALQADLTAAASINSGVDLEKWKEKFDEHISDLADTSKAVRAKLGLPAANEDDGTGEDISAE
jgi:hypothetical protein